MDAIPGLRSHSFSSIQSVAVQYSSEKSAVMWIDELLVEVPAGRQALPAAVLDEFEALSLFYEIESLLELKRGLVDLRQSGNLRPNFRNGYFHSKAKGL